MMFTRDDFTRWREDPVTRAVFRALEGDAKGQEAEWSRISWVNGVANQRVLDELRTRADAYRAMAEVSYEGICEALGEEPRDE